MDGRSRVVLPRRVLAELGVRAGDYVSFVVRDGSVELRRVEWRLGAPPADEGSPPARGPARPR